MNETVGCGKEGNQLGMENWRVGESDENSRWKYPVHASLEKEGKIINCLSSTLLQSPKNC